MKTSEEMLEELFARREKYYAERREKMRNARKVICATAGCLVMLLAVGIPITNLFLSSKDDDLLIKNSIANVRADASSTIRKGMMPDNSADLEAIDGEPQKEETPESIAKILSLDTLGGAIDIVNINDLAAPEEAQKGRMP